MKKVSVLLVAVAMLMAACGTTQGIKEELIDENGNVLSWTDCFEAIQEYVGDQKLYDKLLAICQAQDPAGYEAWQNKVTSKIRLSK